MRSDRGTLLIVAGVALFVLVLGIGAATAPDRGVDDGKARQTLIGIQGGGPGWHQYGEVQLRNGSEVQWQETSADSYFDVQRLDDGTILAGFMDSGRQNCEPYDAPCAYTGFRVIDPDAAGGPQVIEEYGFPVRTEKNSESHDVEPLPEGGYVVSDMDRERIFIVKDGQIVWQWNASTLYDVPDDPTRTDWLHLNDVDYIGEDRFLVSIRNANQLVIVERTDDGGSRVVEIINKDRDATDDDACQRDGGLSAQQLQDTDGDGQIRCGDPAVLDHQHNPQWLGDGAILVADSDNDRVVELHRSDGNWTVAWRLRTAGGLDLSWPRDADRLDNGHTLITDTLNKRVVEIDENGTVVWSVSTERIPYEADRVPREETGGLPQADSGMIDTATTPGGEDRSQIPLLSTVTTLVKAVVPSVPFWYAEREVAATIVALGLIGAGVVLRIRE